jgi:hypothetical protein
VLARSSAKRKIRKRGGKKDRKKKGVDDERGALQHSSAMCSSPTLPSTDFEARAGQKTRKEEVRLQLTNPLPSRDHSQLARPCREVEDEAHTLLAAEARPEERHPSIAGLASFHQRE